VGRVSTSYMGCNVLQCAAVCCSVLQCATVYYRVLQSVACVSTLHMGLVLPKWQYVDVYAMHHVVVRAVKQEPRTPQFIHVTEVIHVRDVTRSYVWHGTLTCANFFFAVEIHTTAAFVLFLRIIQGPRTQQPCTTTHTSVHLQAYTQALDTRPELLSHPHTLTGKDAAGTSRAAADHHQVRRRWCGYCQCVALCCRVL